MLASPAKLFSVAALALAAVSGANAAECTADEISALGTSAQLVYADSSCSSITTDLSTATQAEVCESKCMDYLSSILSEFPDCEYGGMNLHTSLEELISACGGDTGAASVSTLGYASVAVAVAALALAA